MGTLMLGGLKGLRYFANAPEVTRFKDWSSVESVARFAQYPAAVLFGRVVQIDENGRKTEVLDPSRIKLLLPAVLLAGVAVYVGLQKVALIGAATVFIASALGVGFMSYSENQGLYNDAYVRCIHDERLSGQVPDKARLADEVQQYGKDLQAAAENQGWFSGASVDGALSAFVAQCEKGTTALVTYLLEADEAVFEAVYKPAGNLLMEKMVNRDSAQAVMSAVLAATPKLSDVDKCERFKTFLERFARRGENYSGTDWTSEICDSVKGNPVALAAVLVGLTAKRGSIGAALARGFTVETLTDAINRGRLPIDTLGAMAVALEAAASQPRLQSYAPLLPLCEARLSDSINRLKHSDEEVHELSPQTEAFNKLQDPKIQAKWIQVSLGASWLQELGVSLNLAVAVNGLSGDLAKVDGNFLTAVLERLLTSGTKEQVEKVVALANMSTLQARISQALSEKQIALVQMLAVKHGLDSQSVAMLIQTNPAAYTNQLLEVAGEAKKQMIWRTFGSDVSCYPQPRSLSLAVVEEFYGLLPQVFKASVTGVSANLDNSIERLVGVYQILNESAMVAFEAGLDKGQKAILGHYLAGEVGATTNLATRFGPEKIEAWKNEGSVGAGYVYNGYLE